MKRGNASITNYIFLMDQMLESIFVYYTTNRCWHPIFLVIHVLNAGISIRQLASIITHVNCPRTKNITVLNFRNWPIKNLGIAPLLIFEQEHFNVVTTIVHLQDQEDCGTRTMIVVRSDVQTVTLVKVRKSHQYK